jgi:hypothetical protein
MNPTDNNAADILNSLGQTADKVSSFLTDMQKSLTPEQKKMLDKEMGGSQAFQQKMKEAQDNLTKALSDIHKFNKFGV